MRTLIVLALLVGCASPPRPAPPLPTTFYEINPDLKQKADEHYRATIAMLDSSGLLLYRPSYPWGTDERGLSNYLRSHDIADAPAWHGMFMQALALKWAVEGVSTDDDLNRMAGGLLSAFEVTGRYGVLGRSWISDYAGPRLEWMTTEEERPTKFWTQGRGGAWYRNGVAKNHWNMAVSGCGLALHLDREGKIQLSSSTRGNLEQALIGLVSWLHEGGWRLREADGETFTEFGDLRPDASFGPEWPELPGVSNGFNRMVVLAALKSASPIDSVLVEEYERLAPEWVGGIGDSMELVGEVVAAIGHDRLEKPSFSDMQAFATAATLFLLQEDRRELTRHVTRGLHGLWEYMRYENNPPFSLAYAINRPGSAKLDWVVELLRNFPGRDGKRSFLFDKRDTSHYQPIQNRPPNTNYWKSSPFRQAVVVPDPEFATNPETGDPQEYAGADYLYAYYLGRYLGLVPEK